MRLKRFVFPDTGNEVVLHPAISVLPNLTSAERYVILRSVGLIAMGGDEQTFPEVEVDGSHLKLTPEVVESLGLAGIDSDLVITSHNVEEALRSDDAFRVDPFDPSKLDIPRFLMSTPSGHYPGLDTARSKYADTVASKNEHAAFVFGLQGRQMELERHLEGLRGSYMAYKHLLTNADAGVDPTADEAIRPLKSQLRGLEGELKGVESRIRAYEQSDMGKLKEMVDTVRLESNTISKEIAEQIIALSKEVNGVESELEESGIPLGETLQRYANASNHLDIISKSMSGPVVSDAEHARLDDIRAEIAMLENSEGIKRTAEIRALELERQQVLERLGFPTWSAYLMSEQVAAADPLTSRDREKARLSFNEAEEAWMRVSAHLQSREGYLDTVETLNELVGMSCVLLGYSPSQDVPIDKLVMALQSSIVPLGEPTVASKSLMDALDSFGMRVNDSRDVVFMVETAERLLAEESVLSAIQDLGRDRENILLSIQTIFGRIRVIEDERLSDASVLVGKTAHLRAEIHKTEQSLSLLAEEISAKMEMGEVFAKNITSWQRRINDMVLVIAEEQYRVENGLDMVREEPSPQERLERYLFGAFASVRNVGRAGPLPLVFDDPFFGLSEELTLAVLNEVLRLSATTQVIIVTDSQLVTNWALQVGLVQAEVIPTRAT